MFGTFDASFTGNPHIGVLKHEDKLYAFSSKEAAMNFASSADDFVAEIAEKATICPELIHLLKLYQEFSCITPCFEVRTLSQTHTYSHLSSSDSVENKTGNFIRCFLPSIFFSCGFADAARREFTVEAEVDHQV